MKDSPLETESLLTNVTGVKESLKTFGCRQAFENLTATFSRVHRSRTTALEFFLPPALLDRIRDIHEFGTDRAAICLAQGGEQRAQRHFISAEIGVSDVKLCVEICVRQAIEIWIELRNHRRLVTLERIKLSTACTEHTIGGNELLHENLFTSDFQILTADIANDTSMGPIGKARDNFRM